MVQGDYDPKLVKDKKINELRIGVPIYPFVEAKRPAPEGLLLLYPSQRTNVVCERSPFGYVLHQPGLRVQTR